MESAGRAGLVAAAQTWSPSLGVHFSYYCRFRIRGAMLDELRSMDPAKRRASRNGNGNGNGHNGHGPGTVSIDDVIVYDEPGPDRLTFNEFPDGLLRLLDERERRILFSRYAQDMYFSEIGAEMGISATRVGQIHDQMIIKATHFYKANGMRARA